MALGNDVFTVERSQWTDDSEAAPLATAFASALAPELRIGDHGQKKRFELLQHNPSANARSYMSQLDSEL
jgi:hypothetical protein